VKNRIDVIINRPDGSKAYEYIEHKVERIIASLKPHGVRIRVAVAPSTLRQHVSRNKARRAA
jgi:hypothetical protein